MFFLHFFRFMHFRTRILTKNATCWSENAITPMVFKQFGAKTEQTLTIDTYNRESQQTLTMDTIDTRNRHLQQTLTIDTYNRHTQETLTIDTYNRHVQQTLAIDTSNTHLQQTLQQILTIDTIHKILPPSVRVLCWDNFYWFMGINPRAPSRDQAQPLVSGLAVQGQGLHPDEASRKTT